MESGGAAAAMALTPARDRFGAIRGSFEMKEVLKMQGLINHATVWPPQLPIGDAERAELLRLATFAGRLDSVPLRAVGDSRRHARSAAAAQVRASSTRTRIR